MNCNLVFFFLSFSFSVGMSVCLHVFPRSTEMFDAYACQNNDLETWTQHGATQEN